MNQIEPRHETEVERIISLVAHQVNHRNTFLFRLLSERPIRELRLAIDLFKALQYKDAVAQFVQLLSRNISPDYCHMVMCYIARAYAHMGLLHSAESVFDEARKIPLPQHYLATSVSIEDETRKDISLCRSRFPSEDIPAA
ncbi:MAG: hypothetical protein WC712_00945 [Candidatus Brocadiia bacterium]